MKKILVFILTLAMTLTLLPTIHMTASASSTILDISKGNILITSGGVSGYDATGSEVSGIFDEYIITGTSANQYSVDVQSGTHNITLDNLSITCTNTNNGSPLPHIAPIKMISGVVVNFTVIGNNTIKSGYNQAGISVPEGATATFGGNGSITITTGQYSAGIGGNAGFHGGTVTINSGTFHITGGYNAAGIGGSNGKKRGGIVTINGGSVTTRGGDYGAGIGGGGGDGPGEEVRINGGTVITTGGKNGAGIGGGNGGSGGYVEITGGTVTAQGGTNAAGIGGSGGSTGAIVSITGGTVTTTGGSNAAGIGGGGSNGAGNSVSITGGFVKAYAGTYTRHYSAEAIGCGAYDEGTIPKSSGTRTFGATANKYAGDQESSAVYISEYTGQRFISVIFNIFSMTDSPLYISSTGFRRSYEAVEVAYTGEYVLTGTTASNVVVVESGTPNITLRDLNIDVIGCAFALSSGANAFIILQGSNSLKSGAGYAGMNVPAGAAVTISGGETIFNNTGGAGGAGIGGNSGEGAGSITITDGTVTATGGTGAAGIGGGSGGIGGNVTITGGSIKAIPGAGADTIGGGSENNGTGSLTNGSDNLTLIIKAGVVLGNATRLYASSVNGSNYTYAGYGHGDGDTNLYFYLPEGFTADSIEIERVGNYADKLECTLLPFTDNNGAINSFQPGTTVNASVTMNNDTGYDKQAIFVMAVYENGVLLGLSIAVPDGNLVQDGDTITLSASADLSQPKYENATQIKTFVWDSADTLSPLIPKGGELNKYEARQFVFGVLQNTQNNIQANYDAGMNMGYFSVHWGQFYTSEGVLNTSYIQERKQFLQNLRNMGYDIMLGIGTQYPPSWIYNYPHSRYVNQYGDEYSTTASGDLAVNMVFNNLMREKIEDYVDDLFSEFGTDFDIIRLGWQRYGEIGYPHPSFNGKTNSYWAFDPYAQGQLQGLPDGIPVCPVPGWIPGTASANNADARAFAEWYMNSLLNFQNWQVDLISSYSNAELAILYPSWGMRETSLENAIKGDLKGTTSPESNGEVQRGFDFKRLIMGITNPKAIVYCTWLDSNPSWSSGDDQPIPTASNNFSPAHYMAYYAKANPLNLKIMGENTGGGGMSALALTFLRMKTHNYDGLMWAFESDLYDGVAPVLSDYASYIADYISDMADR